MQSVRSNSIGFNSSFPASIFEKSRISLRIDISASADSLTVRRHSRCSKFSAASRASSVIPRIPFIGARNGGDDIPSNRQIHKRSGDQERQSKHHSRYPALLSGPSPDYAQLSVHVARKLVL